MNYIISRTLEHIFRQIDIFVPAIELSPGGSSTVHIYIKQQYIEEHNNTDNKRTEHKKQEEYTEIEYTQEECYLNLSKVNHKRICLTQKHNIINDNTK
jgi:hypothetical protein